MIQKKICLLGAFAVGKTSLIQRYVNQLFSDKYLTTVGVKIDKKQLLVNEQEVMLMIWDLAGEDSYTSVRPSYLRGMAGAIIVLDGKRHGTLAVGRQLLQLIREQVGNVPVIFAVNKADLKHEWAISDSDLASLAESGCEVVQTSAKLGDQVEYLFSRLAADLIAA